MPYLDSDSPLGERMPHDPDAPTGWAVGWLGLAIGVIVVVVMVWRMA